MVDARKYLYWCDVNNPDFDKEVVWREMYSRIGYLFHLYQMCEYHIANILAIELFEKNKKVVFTDKDINDLKKTIDDKFNSLFKLTFGQLKKKVKKSKYLKDIDFSLLESVISTRNDLAHNCFKNKLLNNELNIIEEVDKFIDELNEYEEKAFILNEYLVKVFKDNKIKQVLVMKF